MISIEQHRYGCRRFLISKWAATVLIWWAERRIRRNERRTLIDLPDRFLRDVGLEHLIDVHLTLLPVNHSSRRQGAFPLKKPYL